MFHANTMLQLSIVHYTSASNVGALPTAICNKSALRMQNDASMTPERTLFDVADRDNALLGTSGCSLTWASR